MSSGLTDAVARFAADLSGSDLPAGAVKVASQGFADCVAVTFAGWRTAPVSVLLRHAGGRVAPERPFAPGSGPASERALIHAAAAHVLDWDDTALSGHPSAVLVPAILAEALERPVSGRRMIAAWLAGYETWAELVLRDPDPLHASGWHPSATIGAPAAAAAIAALRGLAPGIARDAVSLSASMAGGVTAQFGSPAKCWQLARAAEAGIAAADLAEAGLKGAADVLEHEGGLLAALSSAGRVDLDRPPRIGRNWAVLDHGLNLKLYPVCYAMHRALDAAKEVRIAHAPDPAAIARVQVEIGATQAAILRNARPQNGLDARFSVQFGIAAMLIAGACGQRELEDGFVRRRDVQDLMARVEIVTTEARLADEPAHSPWDRVTIEMADGPRLVSGKVIYPLGHFRNPAGPGALRGKFSEALEGWMDEGAQTRLFDMLMDLDNLPDSALLSEAMAGRVANEPG